MNRFSGLLHYRLGPVVAAALLLGLPGPGAAAGGDGPLLRVDGFSLSAAAFEKSLATWRAETPPERLDAVVEENLRSYREKLLLAAAARAAGLESDPSVAQLLGEHRTRLLGETFLAREIDAPARAAARERAASQGASEESLLPGIRDAMLLQVQRRVLEDVGVSRDEAALASAVGGGGEDLLVATYAGGEVRYRELLPGLRKVAHPDGRPGSEVRIAGNVLDEVIFRKVLLRAAAERGYDRDPEFLDDLQIVTVKTLAETWLTRKVTRKIKVLPEEVRARYERRREELRRGQEKEIREIFVRDAELAGRIHRRLQEGADFAALVAEYSEGVTKDRGGFIGYHAPGSIIEPLNTAIGNLAPGQFSVPIPSRYGFHILRCDGVVEGRIPELAEVGGEIEKEIFSERRKEAHEQTLRELEQAHPVVFDEDLYRRIRRAP